MRRRRRRLGRIEVEGGARAGRRGEDANGERGQESGAAIEGQGHPSHRGLWRGRVTRGER